MLLFLPSHLYFTFYILYSTFCILYSIFYILGASVHLMAGMLQAPDGGNSQTSVCGACLKVETREGFSSPIHLSVVCTYDVALIASKLGIHNSYSVLILEFPISSQKVNVLHEVRASTEPLLRVWLCNRAWFEAFLPLVYACVPARRKPFAAGILPGPRTCSATVRYRIRYGNTDVASTFFVIVISIAARNSF